jgi:hypothetical protein
MHSLKQDSRRERLGIFLCLAGAFLALVALRWEWVRRTGSPLPFWDEWDNFADFLAKQARGELRLADFVLSRNEHWVIWTMVTQWLAFVGNEGQWDTQVLMTWNALPGAGVPLMAWAALGGLRDRKALGLPLGAALVLLYFTPVLWFNAIWAYQNCFNYMLLLSGGGLALVALKPELSRWWWVGAALMVLGLGALSGALMAGGALLGLVILRCLRERRFPAGAGWNLAVAALVMGLGALVLLRGQGAPLGQNTRNAAELFSSTRWNFAWPWVDPLPMYQLIMVELPSEVARLDAALLLWLPLPLLLVRVLVLPRKEGRGAEGWEAVIALGAWIYVQLLWIAWTRGITGMGPAWRHFDLHALGIAINVAALLWLARLGWPESLKARMRSPKGRWAAPGLAAAYAVLLVAGLADLSRKAVAEMELHREINTRQIKAVRDYLVTGSSRIDAEVLLDSPFWAPPKLKAWLDQPEIRDMMPVGVRKPLPLKVLTPPGGFSREAVMPTLPRDPHLEYWGNWRPADEKGRLPVTPLTIWEIPPSRFSHLSFTYAGTMEANNIVAFNLLDNNGETVGAAVGETPRWRGWTRESAARPREATQLSVLTSDPQALLFFQAPEEMGRLTYWAHILRTRAALVSGLGAGLALAGLLLLKRPNDRNCDVLD